MITLLASLALQTIPEPAIEISSAAPKKGYVMKVADYDPDFNLTPVLQKRADAKCGTLSVRFGKFNYDNTVLADGKRRIVNYVQRFECFDPATDPFKPVPADWKPSDTDKADVKAFANRQLTAIDKGDAATGMPMMEASLEITKAEWMDTTNRLLEHSRAGGTWTIDTQTWANNPEGTSHPGAYVLLPINGTYSNLAAYCGYLLIYREGPGRYWISQRSLKVIPQAWIDDGSIQAAKINEICNS